MYIRELRLATTAFSQQAHFYTQVLEFPLLQSSHNTLVFRAGTSQLIFTQDQSPAPYRYHIAFNIPSNQFSAAVSWLRERVQLIADSDGKDEFFSPDWNSHGAYFYDPAGNIVEFIARHTLPSDTAAPFNGDSILEISEIGIAAEDVLSEVQRICARSGAQIYNGPADPTFTAVGDEHGLLIVVRRGRIWFPETTVPALHVPITLITANGENDLAWRYPV